MWSGIVKFFIKFVLPSIVERLVIKAEQDISGSTMGIEKKSFVINTVMQYLVAKGWDKYFNTMEISDLIDKKVKSKINNW